MWAHSKRQHSWHEQVVNDRRMWTKYSVSIYISNDCIASLAATMAIFCLTNSTLNFSLSNVSLISIARNFSFCKESTSDCENPETEKEPN